MLKQKITKTTKDKEDAETKLATAETERNEHHDKILKLKNSNRALRAQALQLETDKTEFRKKVE